MTKLTQTQICVATDAQELLERLLKRPELTDLHDEIGLAATGLYALANDCLFDEDPTLADEWRACITDSEYRNRS